MVGVAELEGRVVTRRFTRAPIETTSTSTLRHSTGPPVQTVLRTSAPPPLAPSTNGTSRTPPDQAETDNQWQPGRYLDPEIAASVQRAKERTRRTWRWIAERIGVSHSHLVLIAQGRRVPSRAVVEAMSALPFEDGELDRLRGVAVEGRGRSR